MKLFFFIFLGFNVIGIALYLIDTHAIPIYYINLIGCVVFGYFLRDSKIIQ